MSKLNTQLKGGLGCFYKGLFVYAKQFYKVDKTGHGGFTYAYTGLVRRLYQRNAGARTVKQFSEQCGRHPACGATACNNVMVYS